MSMEMPSHCTNRYEGKKGNSVCKTYQKSVQKTITAAPDTPVAWGP